MSRKALRISLKLDVEGVTCPGVWLCPRGKIYLRICMLEKISVSKAVRPCFPLQFLERFHYQKIIHQVSSVNQLREYLSKTNIYIELIQDVSTQCETILAVFRTSVADLLYPIRDRFGEKTKTAVSLLMDATERFPGKLAPKIEVETCIMIDEMINYPLRGDSWILNPKAGDSQEAIKTKLREKGKIYQKPVCHSKRTIDPCISCKSLPPEMKNHVPHRSSRQFSCRTNEKENIDSNCKKFSTTTFTKDFDDESDSGNICGPDACALCASYERKMEVVNKRSRSVPKSKYYSMPIQKYPKILSPSKSKFFKSKEEYSSPCGTSLKNRTLLSSKPSKPMHKPHLAGPRPHRHYHKISNTVDLSSLRESNERLLASVFPDKASSSDNHARSNKVKSPNSLLHGMSMPAFTRIPDQKTKGRVGTRVSEPKACSSQSSKSSKLKCCTNCYCIVCSKCKQKINLDKEVCSKCQVRK